MKQIEIKNGFVYIPTSIASATTSLIFAGEKDTIMMDCGDGTLTFLLNKKIENISEIFISHDHMDHIGGLLSILAYFKIKKIFPNIYHPKNSLVIRLIKEYFQKRYKKQIFKFIEMKEGKIIKFNWGNILPHKAQHSSKSYPLNALCFEMEFLENSIFYSGDTGYFEKLKNYIENKDIAFIEASYKEKERDMSDFHLSLKKANMLGKLTKNYYLIHKEE
ncbi:ribonuclease Z [bacterium]|nr:ribonuclease Z [bacterium]